MGTKEIEAVIAKIQEEKCISEEDTFEKLEEYLPDITAVFMGLISELPELKARGIELPEDVILQQVKNLEEAVAHRDLIKLYDTLKYEILNTFEVYREIRMEAV